MVLVSNVTGEQSAHPWFWICDHQDGSLTGPSIAAIRRSEYPEWFLVKDPVAQLLDLFPDGHDCQCERRLF